ncbi:hypothetical protein LCGC14_1493180 [marine sediment metagenome]|uniref:Methyltransferase domain-containing protein n=1 Tax=marine sediment metagenome TaxID=412755 RepID=A0A0F9J6S6_9ZZZZ
MKKLVECFDKYKCDKGSLKHRYDRVYELALEPLRNKEFDLLEIGIFKGNSLEALVEYAPRAQIVGLDTFQRIQPNDISILQHDNVEWLKCDSTEPTTLKRTFDIIIDDGLHTHEAQRKTFANFFPYLKDDGVYFIEDVWPFDIMGWMEKQHPWLKKHPMSWNDTEYEKLLETVSPYNVTFHDIREGYDPDTFIIEIRK